MIIGLIIGAIVGGMIDNAISNAFAESAESVGITGRRGVATITYGPGYKYTLNLQFADEDLKEKMLILKHYRRYYEEEFEFVCVLFEALGVLYMKREKALQVAAENMASSIASEPPKLRELYPSEVLAKAHSICLKINAKTNDILRAFVKKVKSDPEDMYHEHDKLREHAKVIYDANNEIERCLNEVLNDLRHAMGI